MIRRFIERRGVTTAFVWGFSEATLFFFLPDIVVGAVALYSLRRGLRAAGSAIAGAVVGGATLYLVTRGVGVSIRDLLTGLPAIPADFFTTVQEGIRDDGGVAIVRGPWVGIPYKLYAAEWALGGHGLLSLILWTIPARALRIVSFAVLAHFGARLFRRLFGERERLLLGGYALVWVGIYTAYFSSVGW